MTNTTPRLRVVRGPVWGCGQPARIIDQDAFGEALGPGGLNLDTACEARVNAKIKAKREADITAEERRGAAVAKSVKHACRLILGNYAALHSVPDGYSAGAVRVKLARIRKATTELRAALEEADVWVVAYLHGGAISDDQPATFLSDVGNALSVLERAASSALGLSASSRRPRKDHALDAVVTRLLALFRACYREVPPLSVLKRDRRSEARTCFVFRMLDAAAIPHPDASLERRLPRLERLAPGFMLFE